MILECLKGFPSRFGVFVTGHRYDLSNIPKESIDKLVKAGHFATVAEAKKVKAEIAKKKKAMKRKPPKAKDVTPEVADPEDDDE